MANEFKSDLGLHLLKEFGDKIVHHYYDVPITQIDHVGDGLYSIPIVMTLEREYFASFDFTTEKLLELLRFPPDPNLTDYAKGILLKDFYGLESVDFTGSPIIVNIDAVLGEPVTTMTESFVPLIVKRFSKN